MNAELVARFTNGGARLPRVALPLTRVHARAFRLTRGRVGRRWFGAPVLVLETVGRRSGRSRSTPLLYLPDGDALVVLAANAGSDQVPGWWLNLRDANAGVVVLGGRRRRVRPRELDGAERDRLWRAYVAMYPATARYTDFTDRRFPLVALDPA